jgi:hypothetical protein
MKYVKMLGLAALAAMALMAIVGASTASATTLQQTNGAHPTTLNATVVGSALLTSTSGSTLNTCTESTVHGTPSTGGASETVRGAATVSFSGCVKKTTTIGNGELEIHHIPGTSNGTVTGTTFEVTIEPFEGVWCNYGLSKTDSMVHVGTLEGSHTTPKIVINTVVVERGSSFICPDDANWKATYHITSPSDLTVVSG